MAAARFQTGRAAQWVIANGVVLGIAILPLTGWILGAAIAATQLWRISWFMPFGICAALLAVTIWERVAQRAARGQAWFQDRLLPVCAFVLLVSGIVFLTLTPEKKSLHALRAPPKRDKDYAALSALGSVLDAQLAQPTRVVGADHWINDRLPSVTTNARLIAFRTVTNMWQLGNLTRSEARTRKKDWNRLAALKTLNASRVEILQNYQVRYLLAQKSTAWVNQLVQAYPAHFALTASDGDLRLYRFTP